MPVEGYIPKGYDLVPGEWVEYSRSMLSSKYEADDGRTFWVSHNFIRMVRFKDMPGKQFGECSSDYMPADMIPRINYLKPGRLRRSLKETKRCLRQRMEVTQFPSLTHRREFETALAAGKVREGKELEYRYVTTANNGRRTLNRISLGGIFTSETI